LRLWLLSFLLFTIAAVFSANSETKGVEKRIIVIIQPTAQSFAHSEQIRLKVSITNRSRADIGFGSCPNPYEIQIWDHLGNVVALKPQVVSDPVVDSNGQITTIVEVPLCVHDFERTIKRGGIWTEEIQLSNRWDLKPAEIYTLQVFWNFPMNFRKVGDNVSINTVKVPSNRTNITITE
jgi:hypothetical protein